MEEALYRAYVKILKEELVPAMGCTEPIAVAYAGALARRTLGTLPQSVDVQVSANIIKNVKSVVVPHTGGLRGMSPSGRLRMRGGRLIPTRDSRALGVFRRGRIARPGRGRSFRGFLFLRACVHFFICHWLTSFFVR